MHLPGVTIAPPEPDEENVSALTSKQELFCQEYVKDFNGSRAARAAGYSEGSAGQIAYDLLQMPKIKRRIRFAKQELLDRTNVDRDWIAQRLIMLMDTNMTDVAEWGPETRETREDGVVVVSPGVSLIPSNELSRNASYAVQEIGNTKDGVKIKLHDKRAVAADLAKLLGLTMDRVEHSGKVEHTGSVGPDTSTMTPEQLRAYQAFLVTMAPKPATGGESA